MSQTFRCVCNVVFHRSVCTCTHIMHNTHMNAAHAYRCCAKCICMHIQSIHTVYPSWLILMMWWLCQLFYTKSAKTDLCTSSSVNRGFFRYNWTWHHNCRILFLKYIEVGHWAEWCIWIAFTSCDSSWVTASHLTPICRVNTKHTSLARLC